MKKGIVMEINDTFLTLLTPDGQFLNAEKQEHLYTLGEEIVFTPISQKKPLFINRFMGGKQLSIAAAVLFLFIGTMFPLYQSNKAYAYMSIDVNPSIELGINKQMQVIQLTAFNKAGKKIISHIGEWKKKDVADIAQVILNEMKKEGYFNKKRSMIISTVRTENREEHTEEELSKNMGKIKKMAKEDNLHVTVINGTEQELEKAHQLGITTGIYKETKIQSSKKNSTQQNPAKSQENEEIGNGLPDSGSSQSVIQDQHEAVQPNAPASNGNDGGNEQQGAVIDNHIPPGQEKKAEEVPKEQMNPPQSDSKNPNGMEKKSPSINNGEKKSPPINNGWKKDHSHSDNQNQNSNNHHQKN